MTHVVELGADNNITLPADLTRGFRFADRFLVIVQGDTVILKRITPLNVLDRVAAATDDEPPPTMEEISEMVHEVRRQYRRDCQDADCG